MRDVYHQYQYKAAPRGMPIREILNYGFCIRQPYSESPTTKDSTRNKIIKQYFQREKELYGSGTKSADDFGKAAKMWLQIQNPDGTVNSAYGHLIWFKKSVGHSTFGNGRFMTPWEWAKESLIRDRDTRQAILRFSLPEHQWFGNKDQVCTMHGTFHIRDGRLHLCMVTRATEVFYGFPYDVPWFMSLMDRMLEELKDVYPDLQKGLYTQFVHSLQMYERDREAVEKMLGLKTSAPPTYSASDYDAYAKAYAEEQEKFYEARESGSRTMLYESMGDVADKKILDAGCGYGKDAARFISLGADVYGIDASEEMIAIAGQRYPQLAGRLKHGNFVDTGYSDEHFDLIFSRCALQHAFDIEAALCEWHRILKPGGRIVFAAGHPLMQLQFTMNNRYHEQEVVEIPLFGGKASVREPTHTMQDYLNPFVLSHFDVLDFKEKASDQPHIETGMTVPDFFMMSLRKR